MSITQIPAPNYPASPPEFNLSVGERKNAMKAAQALEESFPWYLSAEGEDFWHAVYRRLLGISYGEPLK